MTAAGVVQPESTAPPIVLGNAAKLYCMQRVESLAVARGGRIRVVDLGCGSGGVGAALLKRFPESEYVGVEPSEAAAVEARRALEGRRARIVCSSAYDLDLGPADVVLSFSVMEHVYRRRAYLECLARHLGPEGVALVNYDAGHFVGPGPLRTRAREVAKTVLGRVLARAGREGRYQRFVPEAEFRALAGAVGLEVVEAKAFNTDLKSVFKAVPEDRRDEFMRRWLQLELFVNDAGLRYTDELARVFRTRNFVLRRAAGG